MADPPPISSKTRRFTASTHFLSSYDSFSQQFLRGTPPQSFTILSQNLPLPPVPTDLPRSKIIPKSRFVIDGFRNAGSFSVTYFLSHFHSDHYTGLNSSWCAGLIFCSETTARLLVQHLGVSHHFVVPLPLRETVVIDDSEIILIDANHCPGAVQFLFRIRGNDGYYHKYVHTGDFRFCDSMKLEPALRQFVCCDAVFLDTTYCNPKFNLPSQEDAITYIVNAINRIKHENREPTRSVLFLVATYVLGKERILLEISRRCNCLLHVDSKKMSLLRTLGMEGDGNFTLDAFASDVHVIEWNVLGETWPYFRPNFAKMGEIMGERGHSRAVGFVPTGWMYEAKKDGFAIRTKDSLEIHLVPYSEHSSYPELREYVGYLKPKQVVPTVGMNIEDRDGKQAIAIQKHFAGLVNETANKHEFLKTFYSVSCDDNENDQKILDIDSVGVGSTHVVGPLPLDCSPDINIDLGSTPILEKHVLGKCSVLPGEDLVKEIRSYLPGWVTQNMVLDLLNGSGGDMVDAISVFYEHETELHAQIQVCNDQDISECREYCPDISESTQVSSGSTPGESIKNENKLSYGSLAIKKPSPGKGAAVLNNKLKKKARHGSRTESSGHKQMRLTKFFRKHVRNADHSGELCLSLDEECLGGSCTTSQMVEPYKEELDQLLQIINGISRDQASSIIEEAKGDINTALDIFYGNSGVNMDSEDRSLKARVSEAWTCYNGNGSFCTVTDDVSEGRELIFDPSPVGISPGEGDVTYVALPVEKYSPVQHACWRIGQTAPYLHLARTFDLVEQERGKTKVTGMLCNMFRSTEVGSGSTMRRKKLVINLMRACREKEMKFIVRTLVRNLRIGAMMRTILPALAQAVALHSYSSLFTEGAFQNTKSRLQAISETVVEAYNLLPSLDMLVPCLLSEGINFSPTSLSMIPGIPVKPMLARVCNGINQVLMLFQRRAFTCEFKYDGQRAQIHKLEDGSIKVFSRNGEETTTMFPDLVNIVRESCRSNSKTFILDAEVVAVDRKNRNKLMPFQQLSSRERGGKYSLVTVDSVKVDICVYVFDIVFYNGERLLSSSLRLRRQYLKDVFHEEKLGYMEFVKQITVEAEAAYLTDETTLARINLFFEEAFNSSCEGIMVKSLDVDAEYAVSKRTNTWVKVKRDYLDGINDTLDLVPIGAWHGNGRKAGWYSPFLMACYNPDAEEFQSVCRVMSGFSDSFYIDASEFFSGDKILPKKPSYYRSAEVPDMWFSPEVVWQIRGADLTISPVHQAAVGLVHPDRGISVRFPRFVRLVLDRKPEDCSTSMNVADMFHSQTRKMDVT